MLITDTFKRDLSDLPTAYFALVMATGIVSIASFYFEFNLLAVLLFYFNIVAYLVLSILYTLRIIAFPSNFLSDVKDHAKSPGLLTFVAGSCVLGSQFVIIAGNLTIAITLFYIGVITWFILIYTVFTVFTVKDNKPPINKAISGVWLLIIVSTQSISVLGSQVSGYIPFSQDIVLFFFFWAIGTWWIPLIFILDLWRHIYKQFPLKYHPQYWGMIFPLGMYTACTVKLSQALELHFLIVITSVFKLIALVAWLIAAMSMFYSLSKDYLLTK